MEPVLLVLAGILFDIGDAVKQILENELSWREPGRLFLFAVYT